MSNTFQGPIAGTSGLLAGIRRGASLGAVLRGRLGPDLFPRAGWVIDNPGGNSYTYDAETRTLTTSSTGTLSSYPRLRFLPGLEAGKRYEVKGQVSGDTSLIQFIRLATAGGDNYVDYDETTGAIDGVVTAATDALEFLVDGQSATGTFTIDRLSVREAFPILGPELVTNGGFDDTTGWSSGSAWTIGGGILTATDVPAYNIIGQPFTTSAGRKYEVTYDVVEFTSGSVRASLTGGSTVVGTSRTAVGSYREVITSSDAHTSLNIGSAGAGFTGKIDNVSVREIL